MARRVSSLDNTTVGIDREIGSEYDKVKIVADNISSVSSLGGNIEEILVVATNIAGVTAVVGDIANINTVAEDIASVVLVSTNIAAVATVTANIGDINNAASNAASALLSANASAVSEANSSTSEDNAETSKVAALGAKDDAVTAKVAALLAQANAETAESNSETAENNAETAETNSVIAKNAAETAKNAAETAESNAETAESNAETAQTAAELAQAAAEAAQSASYISETSSALSESAAASSATASANSASASGSAATTALLSLLFTTGIANTTPILGINNAGSDTIEIARIDTSDRVVLGDSVSNTIIRGAMTTIEGNLTVTGTQFIVNSNEVNIGDAILKLNADATGAATENAGFEIERGDDVNVLLIWDEANNRWLVDQEFFVNADVNATGTITATGTSVFASLDISGDIDVDGTSNFDVVDIDGAVNMATTLQVDGEATFTTKIIANGGIALADNDKATFGTGNDLEIYHDASNSYITDVGTGNLKIGGANVEITTAGGTKYFQGAANVAKLYHTGNQKLATASSGISVSGSVAATTDINVGGAVKGNAGTRAVSIGTAGSVSGGLQLWAATDQQHFVQFGDESGTAANHYRGFLGYNHATDSMQLGTAGAARVTIASSGAATFSGDVYAGGATAAYFSSAEAITAPTAAFRPNSATVPALYLGNATADGPIIKLMDATGTSRGVFSVQNSTAKTLLTTGGFKLVGNQEITGTLGVTGTTTLDIVEVGSSNSYLQEYQGDFYLGSGGDATVRLDATGDLAHFYGPVTTASTLDSIGVIKSTAAYGIINDVTGGNAVTVTQTSTATNSSGIQSDISGQSWLYGVNWAATDGRWSLFDATLGAEVFRVDKGTKAAHFAGTLDAGNTTVTTLVASNALTVNQDGAADASLTLDVGNALYGAQTYYQEAGANKFAFGMNAAGNFRLYNYTTSTTDFSIAGATGAVTVSALDVGGNVTATGGAGAHTIEARMSSASNAGDSGSFKASTNDGAAMASAHRVGTLVFAGADDSSGTMANVAAIVAVASENWSGSAHGTEIQWQLTPNGSTSRAAKMVLSGDGDLAVNGRVNVGDTNTASAYALSAINSHVSGYGGLIRGGAGSITSWAVYAASGTLLSNQTSNFLAIKTDTSITGTATVVRSGNANQYLTVDMDGGVMSFIAQDDGTAFYPPLLFKQKNNSATRTPLAFDGDGNGAMSGDLGVAGDLDVSGTATFSGGIYFGGSTEAHYTGSESLTGKTAAFRSNSATIPPIYLGNLNANGPILNFVDSSNITRGVFSIDGTTTQTVLTTSFGFKVAGDLDVGGDVTIDRASGTDSKLVLESGDGGAFLVGRDISSGRVAFGQINNAGGTNNIIDIGFGNEGAGVTTTSVLKMYQDQSAAFAGTLNVSGDITIAKTTPIQLLNDTRSISFSGGEDFGGTQWYSSDASGIGAHNIGSMKLTQAGSGSTPATKLELSAAASNTAEHVILTLDGTTNAATFAGDLAVTGVLALNALTNAGKLADLGGLGVSTIGLEQSSAALLLGYGVSPSTTTQEAFISSYGPALSRSGIMLGGNSIELWAAGSTTTAVGSAVTMTKAVTVTTAGAQVHGTLGVSGVLTVNATGNAAKVIAGSTATVYGTIANNNGTLEYGTDTSGFSYIAATDAMRIYTSAGTLAATYTGANTALAGALGVAGNTNLDGVLTKIGGGTSTQTVGLVVDHGSSTAYNLIQAENDNGVMLALSGDGNLDVAGQVLSNPSGGGVLKVSRTTVGASSFGLMSHGGASDTAFTSRGADNATVGTFSWLAQAADASGAKIMTFGGAQGVLTVPGDLTFSGANPIIAGGDADGYLTLSANDAAVGSLLNMYGNTHATNANDLVMWGGGTIQLHYDHSHSLFDFQSNSVSLGGALSVSSNVAGQSSLLVRDGSGTVGTIATFTIGGYSTILSHDTSYSTMNSNTSSRGWRWQVNSSDALTISPSKAIDMAGTLGVAGLTTLSAKAEILDTAGSGIPLSLDVASGDNTNLVIKNGGAAKWYLRNLGATNDFSLYNNVRGVEELLIDSATGLFSIGGDVAVTGNLTANAFLNIGSHDTLTIATGAITAVKSFQTVDTESAAAADDLITINGGATGNILVLRQASEARDVTIKHNSGGGNIRLAGGADFNISTTLATITLVWIASVWVEISRSANT